MGGSVANEGLVEFCWDGYWGEVCRTDWDVQDATVVCRELGYDVESQLFYSNIDFSDGLIRMINVYSS